MKKFIPTLPSSCCLPLNYSPKAMANLPCEVYLLSVALQKNVTELCFALGKQIGLTKEDLTWAFSMVLSRTFSLPKYDKSSDLGKFYQIGLNRLHVYFQTTARKSTHQKALFFALLWI